MIPVVMSSLADMLSSLLDYLNRLLDAIDGQYYIIGAVLIVLVTSFLLMPLRGGNANIGGLVDYSANHISPRYWNGKFVKGDKNYKGKFLKSNRSARTDRNARLRAK